ncbi:MAG: TolC family protein [Myxococcales bacterium]|nr:TolC family protein [Myxococcales bacterium]
MRDQNPCRTFPIRYSSIWPLSIFALALVAPLVSPVHAQEPDDTQSEVEPAPDISPASQSSHMTLEQAIEAALLRSPTLLAPEDDIAIAQARQLEVDLARWLPSVSGRSILAPSGQVRGNAIQSNSGTDLEAVRDVFEDFGYQTSNSLRFTFPIYTFGRVAFSEDLADVGLEVAELRRRQAELEVVFDVQRAYWGLQLSQRFNRMIETGQERLDDARQRLEDRRLEGDLSVRTDLRRLTIYEADNVGRVVDNEQLSALSSRGLEFYCGVDEVFSVDPWDDELPDAAFASLEEILDLAREHRPDYALLDSAIRAQALRLDLARAEMLPNLFWGLDFTLNYNPQADNQPSPFANDPYNSRGIGVYLGLDWRFDFRQIAQFRRSRVEAEQVIHRYEEASGGIEIEIEQAYLQALGQHRRAEAYHEAYEAANAWLRQRSIQFDSGLIDFEDMSEPLLALFSAEANYFEALFQYRLALADLAIKIGLPRLEPGLGLVGGGGAMDGGE